MLLDTEIARITLTDDLSKNEIEQGILCEIQDGGCGCCVGITYIQNNDKGRTDIVDAINRLEEALRALRTVQKQMT